MKENFYVTSSCTSDIAVVSLTCTAVQKETDKISSSQIVILNKNYFEIKL
jgi:hypothetical protein